MITIRNMEIFEKVVSCGTMAKASKEMFISQSAISQAITDLEESYNVRLFDRIGKSLILTPTGEQLLIHARQIRKSRSAAENYLEFASHKETVRIGATLTVGSSVIWPIMKTFHSLRPEVNTELQVFNTGTLENLLLNGKLDLALVEGRVRSEHLSVNPVIKDNMVLCCGKGHQFWGKQYVSAEQLQGQNFVLREEGSGTRMLLLDILDRENISYHVSGICSSIESLLMAVEYGLGITYISERLVSQEVKLGNLWIFNLESMKHERDFCLIYANQKILSEEMKILADCIRSFKD